MQYLHTAFERVYQVPMEPYTDETGRVFTLADAAAESGDRRRDGWLVLHEERDGCQPRNHWGFTICVAGNGDKRDWDK